MRRRKRGPRMSQCVSTPRETNASASSYAMNEPPTATATFAVSSACEIALVSSMYWKL